MYDDYKVIIYDWMMSLVGQWMHALTG